MHNLSISQKIHIPLIASIAIGFVIVISSFFNSVNEIRDDVYAEEEKILRNTFSEALAIEGLGEMSGLYKENTKFRNIKILRSDGRQIDRLGRRSQQRHKTHETCVGLRCNIWYSGIRRCNVLWRPPGRGKS